MEFVITFLGWLIDFAAKLIWPAVVLIVFYKLYPLLEFIAKKPTDRKEPNP